MMVKISKNSKQNIFNNRKLFEIVENKQKMSQPKHLQGFKVLLIKFSEESPCHHQLFIKEHSVRNQTEDKPVGRTLYVINIPPWVTENSLLKAFISVTPTDQVTFYRNKSQAQDDGYNCGFVVFYSEIGLEKVIQKVDSLPSLSTEQEPITLGIQKWIKEYNNSIKGQHDLEQQMIQVVKNYDKKEEKNRISDEKTSPDGEWTVVTKKSRTPALARTEGVNNKLTELSNKKSKGLKNFYRHQIRQAKKDQLAELRKKVEEEKKKILEHKQRRAFKPF